MKRRSVVILLLVVLFLCMTWLVGCKPTTPRKYLSERKMEEVLYDFHLAVGMLNVQDVDSKDYAYQYELYKLAVLKKHDVTEQQFDESMIYYMRHADKMQEIYQSLAEKMKGEASQLGLSIANYQGDGSFKGDTTNIWPHESCVVLMQKVPYNQLSYIVPADTSFHRGDKICLNFQSCFLYQEGYKDGIAMLTLRFANDSVLSRAIHFSSNSNYELTLEDSENLGLKEVSGFFCLNGGQESTTDRSSANTVKVLILNYIRLFRIHKSGETNTPVNEQKSVGSDKPAIPAKTEMENDSAVMRALHSEHGNPDNRPPQVSR